MYGHSLRLTHRYASTQLINRGLVGGASWQDATSFLEFAANYKVTNNITVSFNAINLTDESIRTFFTASQFRMSGAEGGFYTEGNPMDDSSVPTNRTINEYKTGRQYRLGVRVSF